MICGFDSSIPEGGYFVHRSRTNLVAVLGRSFLENDDPGPVANLIKETLKVYPFVPGGFGTSIGSYLSGEAPLVGLSAPVSPRFVEGTGLAMNTIPPNDFDHYVLLNEVVQAESAEALDEIAKELANPNTPLTSLKFKNQFRTYSGDLSGAADQASYIMFFQSTLPFEIP